MTCDMSQDVCIAMSHDVSQDLSQETQFGVAGLTTTFRLLSTSNNHVLRQNTMVTQDMSHDSRAA